MLLPDHERSYGVQELPEAAGRYEEYEKKGAKRTGAFITLPCIPAAMPMNRVDELIYPGNCQLTAVMKNRFRTAFDMMMGSICEVGETTVGVSCARDLIHAKKPIQM